MFPAHMQGTKERDYLPARIRAARGYTPALTNATLADRLKLSVDQVNQYVSSNRPIPRSRRSAIVQAASELSGLPPEFFTSDWQALPQLPSLDPEIAAEAVIRRAALEEARRRAGLDGRRSGTERREGDRRKYA